MDLVGRLPQLFQTWQGWAVEVLDSHVAYPLLGYFRSSHDNLSWISGLGTVLDAASLVLTTIEGVPRGEAKLFKRVGAHLVEDIYNIGFHRGEPTNLNRSDFEAACDRLEAVGYTLADRDDAWHAFEGGRASYALRLEAMARYWATPGTSWLGDPVALRGPIHPPDDGRGSARLGVAGVHTPSPAQGIVNRPPERNISGLRKGSWRSAARGRYRQVGPTTAFRRRSWR